MKSLLQASPTVALVLAGGAARGAYEVGVVRYVLEDVAKAIGRDVPIDVLCGTSAGSINPSPYLLRATLVRAKQLQKIRSFCLSSQHEV